MPLLLAIAGFELRQQLRGHVFWIVVAVSALMVAGAVWSPDLRVGLSDSDLVSGADFAIRTHLVWSLFYLFTAAAFAGDAVLRDEQTGFAPIIGATPVPRRDHVLGRFLGAFLATAFCYLSVPVALLFAARPDPAAALYALIWFGLPNLLIATALFLVLATVARSLFGAMLGAVALLGLYGAGVGGDAGWSLAEPFGFAAFAEATAAWTLSERASHVPPVAGPILTNRLIWVAIAIAALGLLLKAPAAAKQKRAKPPSPDQASAPRPEPLATPRFSRATKFAQFAARTRLELGQVLLTPVFAILLLLGLAHAGSVLWRLEPAVTATERFVHLAEAFQLTPIMVAFFFAGELYWAERDRRVHDLIAAAPAADAALLLPKLLALSLALLGLALASAAAALLVPLAKGGHMPGLGTALAGWVLPKWWDWTLYGVLALFLQAISPNKLAGWGLFILFLIASLGLERSGFTDPFYRFAEYPTHPVPEPVAGAPFSPFRLYWTGIAILLTWLAVRLAGRAGHDPIAVRWRSLGRRPVRTGPGRAAVG